MRVLRFLFRSLGRLYLVGALLFVLLATHIIVFASTALLALWVDLSGPEFGRIVAVSQGLTLIESIGDVHLLMGTPEAGAQVARGAARTATRTPGAR